MSFEDAPPLRSRELIALLDRHEIAYVLVGGLAAVVHGSNLVTRDFDLTPEWSERNLSLLAAALDEANARLRLESGDLLDVTVDADYLRQFEVSTWRTDFGDLDVVSGTPTRKGNELAGYADLAERAVQRQPFGVTVLVASLDDVIESKTALAREDTDLPALPHLHRLRDRLRGVTGPEEER